jgi:hypothetical protein
MYKRPQGSRHTQIYATSVDMSYLTSAQTVLGPRITSRDVDCQLQRRCGLACVGGGRSTIKFSDERRF